MLYSKIFILSFIIFYTAVVGHDLVALFYDKVII